MPKPKTRSIPKPETYSMPKTSVVPPYRVILHNDDVTPMDFVADTLVRFFISDRHHAIEIMMRAHNDGMAIVAFMPLEYAESKVQGAHAHARANGYPLTFSVERAD